MLARMKGRFKRLRFKRLKVAFDDSAYGRSDLPGWTKRAFGRVLQTVLRPVGVKGFVALPRRREKTTASREAFAYIAMINLMSRRFTRGLEHHTRDTF